MHSLENFRTILDIEDLFLFQFYYKATTQVTTAKNISKI